MITSLCQLGRHLSSSASIAVPSYASKLLIVYKGFTEHTLPTRPEAIQWSSPHYASGWRSPGIRRLLNTPWKLAWLNSSPSMTGNFCGYISVSNPDHPPNFSNESTMRPLQTCRSWSRSWFSVLCAITSCQSRSLKRWRVDQSPDNLIGLFFWTVTTVWRYVTAQIHTRGRIRSTYNQVVQVSCRRDNDRDHHDHLIASMYVSSPTYYMYIMNKRGWVARHGSKNVSRLPTFHPLCSLFDPVSSPMLQKIYTAMYL